MKLAAGLLRSLVRTLPGAGLGAMVAYVALSLSCAFAGSLAAVFLALLVQPGHTSIFGGMLMANASTPVQAGMFALATGIFALLRWQTARLGGRLSSRYGMNLRNTVHAHLIEAPLASLANSTSAEIANVLTYNIEIITQGFTALLQVLVAGVTALVSVAFACWIYPSLLLAAPVFVGVGLLASGAYGREQARVARQYIANLTRLFWMSEDFPQRLRHLRSFGRVDAEKASYGAISGQLCHGYQRQQDLVAAGRLTVELLVAVGIAAGFLLAHRLGGADQSSLIAVCLLLGRVLPYVSSTRQSFQQMRTAAPAFELWRHYVSLERTTTSRAPSQMAAGDEVLQIEHARLQAPTGLEVRGLALIPGTLTLICGDSGIGKSSLVDVLAGMMTPEAFLAHRGEQNISFGEYHGLVRRGAYISQNVRLWQHTVRECLQWAAPEATEDMLLNALADVGLDKRLAQSQQGLDTTLHSSSSRLSGGELQRLMLAQVIVRQPYLAVLDEATSALDTASEVSTLALLKRRLPHTILIVVSHRTSVSAVADQCLTIGDDRIGVLNGMAQVRRVVSAAHWSRA